MKILKQITRKAKSAEKSFLVIGGHAVNALGFARQTGDLDLLISKTDREFWIEFFKDLGYTIFQDHSVFVRLKPPALTAWPVDLMFVSEETFQQLIKEASLVSFGEIEASVPSITHMLSLKLHALKQRQEHREEKDLGDVRQLYRTGKINKDNFRELCKKYDRIDVYEQLEKSEIDREKP